MARSNQCVQNNASSAAGPSRPHTWNTMCPDCAKATKADTVIRDRVCRQCGASFPGGPRAWYCPACRRERKLAADREEKRHGSARKIGSTDLCVQCGSEYIVTSGRQMYCPACKDSATAAAIRPIKREYAKTYAAKRAEIRQSAKHHKICVVCGELIAIDSPTVTCSDDCAKELRRCWQHNGDKRRKRKKENGYE